MNILDQYAKAGADLEEAARQLAEYSLKERSAGLRATRRKYGFTLDEIALLSNLNKSTLSRFERGLTDLKVETYSRLLRTILDIGVARLVVEDIVKRCDQLPSRKTTSGAVPLWVLALPQDAKRRKAFVIQKTKDHVWHRRTQDYVEAIKADYQKKIAEQEKEIADSKNRIAELRDLLKIETEAALLSAKRDELRDKIQRVPSDESED